MSEQSEAAVQAAVGRGCGFVALCVGSVVNALAFTPISAIKAGGYLFLIVTVGPRPSGRSRKADAALRGFCTTCCREPV